MQKFIITGIMKNNTFLLVVAILEKKRKKNFKNLSAM